MKIPARVQRAHRAATQSRKKAYSPYSGFKVGAALVTPSGRIIPGCNVENASYGGTRCAEQVAILKAVSEGEREFSDFVVVTDIEEPAFPCALCLQAMAEFCEPDTRIWIADPRKIHSVHEFKDLLPRPFGPKQLHPERTIKKSPRGKR